MMKLKGGQGLYHIYKNSTIKIQIIRTPEKFAVITLTFEESGFTIE